MQKGLQVSLQRKKKPINRQATLRYLQCGLCDVTFGINRGGRHPKDPWAFGWICLDVRLTDDTSTMSVLGLQVRLLGVEY